jgi:2-aminoethylphosphonate-pyruvate transaminase
MVEPGLELNQPKSWFLNLERYRGDNPPITAPVQSVLALRQALVELGEQGGLAGRHTEVLAQAQRVRSVLRSRGYDLPIRDRDASCTVTLAEIPQGKSWQEWNDACLDAGFVVFGCKEHLKEKYFQISTMGEVPEEELDRFIAFLPENSKPYPGGSKIPRSNWEVEEAG